MFLEHELANAKTMLFPYKNSRPGIILTACKFQNLPALRRVSGSACRLL